MRQEIIVRAIWDKDASVWVAEAMNYPGIVTESPSFDQLLEKLKVMIPEIVEANNLSDDIPFRLLADVCAIAHVPHHA